MKQPMVAGVAGGVGTTTVAAALSATECGVYRSGPVDAVVCRNTVSSLGAAHHVVRHAGRSPVLIVVAGGRESTPKPARARIEMVRPHVASIIEVPWVPSWCELVNPWAQAATVLTQSQQNPKHLRGFTQAIQQARSELIARLQHSSAAVSGPGPAVRTAPPGLPPG